MCVVCICLCVKAVGRMACAGGGGWGFVCDPEEGDG